MPVAGSVRPNSDVARVFNAIADLLEIEGANTFRIRAYRSAARMLTELGSSVQSMVEQGDNLDDLPGIGPDLAGKIQEVLATGTCALLERLRHELPPGIAELLKVPGLGPMRVRALHHELGIRTLQDLHSAAAQDRLRTVHGFGSTLQRRILAATEAHLNRPLRFPLLEGEQIAQSLLTELAQWDGVQQAVAAGSLRRRRDTVGDLDLLVTVRPASKVMQRFTTRADVARVVSQGRTRSSVVLNNGMQVDLRAVQEASFGSAWMYFTGSKAHNIALRKQAHASGLKLNEYGLYRGSQRIAGATEASVYQALGLPWIAPELREDRGELDAARLHRLPTLLTPDDLRGDLHAHTRDSDGHDTLQAMAEAARSRGLQYLAITDHSPRLAVARGLDANRLARQIDAIDALNATLTGIVLLKGAEVDILADGSLDLPDAVLQRLDLVVGAVHEHFNLSREKQTQRLLRAMDQRYFSILAHPCGRMINARPAMELDLLQVLRHAKLRGCFVELNAQPSRLDLDDLGCRMAKDAGVLVSIASDAHSTLELGHLRLGVDQARRGWLEAGDVLNSRPLSALRPLLDATMDRSPAHPASTSSKSEAQKQTRQPV